MQRGVGLGCGVCVSALEGTAQGLRLEPKGQHGQVSHRSSLPLACLACWAAVARCWLPRCGAVDRKRANELGSVAGGTLLYVFLVRRTTAHDR